MIDSLLTLCYHDYGRVIMVRTQVQLTEEQAARLKALASRRGLSISELVRQGIDSILAESPERSREERYRRAAGAAGKFRSNRHDVAVRHDAYLSENYSE